MIEGFNPLSGSYPSHLKKEKTPKPPKSSNTSKIAKSALSKNPTKIEKTAKKGEIKLIPLDESDPFFDTDLIVFEDSYTGILPLNGIKIGKLKEIKTYLESFQNDKTKFNFKDAESLKQPVYEALKLLLTRRLGRDLIFKLEKLEKANEIVIVEHKEHLLETTIHRKGSIVKNLFHMKNLHKLKRIPKSQVSKITKIESKLHLNPSDVGERTYFTIDPNGRRCEAHCPFAIGLAHELVHVLYSERGMSFKKQSPNLSLTGKRPEKNLENREEQATITGLGSPVRIDESKEVDSDFFKDWEPKKNDYFEFNENNFLAAFGLPPRVDHN